MEPVEPGVNLSAGGNLEAGEPRAARGPGYNAVRKGTVVSPREFARAQREMARKKLVFDIDLGVGKYRESVLTCDLSFDYVKINAEYRT